MRCHHYETGECRSCTLLPVPFSTRVDAEHERLRALLAPFADSAPGKSDAVPAQGAGAPSPSVWLPPITGPESGFRNKAKMVVTGSTDSPVLGIVDEAGAGVDLADCPLYPSEIHTALSAVPALIKRAQIPPYDIGRRRGELKYVLVTAGDAAVMVRFVLRTAKPIPRLREHLDLLTDRLAPGSMVTVNLQPDPKAIIEGAEEIHLFGPQTLGVTQGRIRLRLRPQSFLQTNSAVAGGLYTQVSDWIDEIEAERSSVSPLRVWDLFCGVGGFALHAAGSARQREGERPRLVTGVEISAQAIESARATAAEYELAADFHAADAAAWARESAASGTMPDVLIVNPPRRGVGRQMAAWIQDSGISDVVYSSCNPTTLARDLETMSRYRIVAARLLDMFPHTRHSEVVVRLHRR